METLLLTTCELLNVVGPEGSVSIPLNDEQEYRGGFVRLRFPDGSSEIVLALMTSCVPLVRTNNAEVLASTKPRTYFSLINVERTELPIGTEVWLIENGINEVR